MGSLSDSRQNSSPTRIRSIDSGSVSSGGLPPVSVNCMFLEGSGLVKVHQAPVKTLARMCEKVLEYVAEDSSCGGWPLSANILDPVRASVVCRGPSQILQVLKWFTGREPTARGVDGCGAQADACGSGVIDSPVLPVCRVKNKFAFAKEDLVGG